MREKLKIEKTKGFPPLFGFLIYFSIHWLQPKKPVNKTDTKTKQKKN